MSINSPELHTSVYCTLNKHEKTTKCIETHHTNWTSCFVLFCSCLFSVQ